MICVLDDKNVIVNIITGEITGEITGTNECNFYEGCEVGKVYDFVNYAKQRYIEAAGIEFARRRDVIRWVGGYGFDCAAEDIINFMAAFTPLLVAKSGTVLYKVWTSDNDKAVIERSYEQLFEVYNLVRKEQMEAYAWYETVKAKLQAANSIEKLEQIYPLGGE